MLINREYTMKRNTLSFAERLRRGDLLIGTLISLPSPEVTEILAGSGFDWLFIDAEHGAFNPQQAQGMLQAAGHIPCVVRVPSSDEVWIKKALDIGAAGVIVPQVHTADQARAIVRACKYSPAGARGVGIGRAHRYGMAFEQYIKTANKQTAVILQAESKQAVDNIAEIAAVKGVDAIFIGPYDLSASLGRIGRVTDRKVTAAIDRIVKACTAAGVRLGFFGVSSGAVRPCIKKGFTLIAVGVDSLYITKSAQQTLAELRD